MTRFDFVMSCILYGVFMVGMGAMMGVTFGGLIESFFTIAPQQFRFASTFFTPGTGIGAIIGMGLGGWVIYKGIQKNEIPAYFNSPVTAEPTSPSSGELPYTDRNTIVLSDYQISNLKSAIEAAGYGGHKQVARNPIFVLNTGDWIGELYQKLPQTDLKPNATAEELAERAKKFV